MSRRAKKTEPRRVVVPDRTILALDLGTSAGFATNAADGSFVYGTLALDVNPRYDGGGIRFLLFETALVDLFHARWPDLVVFEEVRAHESRYRDGRGKLQRKFLIDAAHVYGGMLSTLQGFCERQEPPVPYLGVGVAVLKKFATGKGNANKDAMIEAARVRLRTRGISKAARSSALADELTDDEADAVLLLDYALRYYGGNSS